MEPTAPSAPASTWHFIGSCLDGQPFLIDGLDVWQQRWESQGRSASVQDPIYHVWQRFNIYHIPTPTVPVEFAAGEFSNGVWGFYRAS